MVVEVIYGKGEITGPQNSDDKPNKSSIGSLERASSLNNIGKEISELGMERARIGLHNSASTIGFWKGMVEETSLIDWSVFSKVLRMTGTMVAMILGSSIVLLIVNTLLAANSGNILYK